MKSRLLSVCFVCLLLFGMLIASAVAEAIPAEYVQSVAMIDGKPAAYGSGALFVLEDNGTWSRYEDAEYFQDIVSFGSDVYGVRTAGSEGQDQAAVEIYRLKMQGNALSSEKLGEAAVNAAAESFTCERACTDGKHIYFLSQKDSADWESYTVWAIDLANFEARKIGEGKYFDLACAADGRVFAAEWDMQKMISAAMDGDGNVQSDVYVLSPSTGERNLFFSMPSLSAGAICYDHSEDVLLYADASRLFRVDASGEAKQCAYLLPSTERRYARAAAGNGKYIVVPSTGSAPMLDIVSTHPEDMPSRVLTVAVTGLSDEMRAFAASRKDLAVTTSEESIISSEDVSGLMMNRDASVDIYQTNLILGSYQAMLQKGFCVDLSGSDILTHAVEDMYPQFRDPLYRDGKLYAFPSSISALDFAMGYNSMVWEDVGLTEDDVPHSFSEFLDVISMWENGLKEDYPEYSLMENNAFLGETLLSRLMLEQMGHCLKKGIPVTFDTPEFRDSLSRIQALLPALRSYADSANSSIWNTIDMQAPTSLLTSYVPSLLPSETTFFAFGGSENRVVPLTVPIYAEDGPIMTLYYSVYTINPNSHNMDAAIECLEYLAEHMSHETKVRFYPDFNEPLESKNYAQQHEEVQTTYDTLSRQMEKAESAEEKDMLTESLEDVSKELERVEDSRYSISEEEIRKYRELGDGIVVLGDLNTIWSDDGSSIMNRFMQGQMDAGQFIAAYERILRMIRMEND